MIHIHRFFICKLSGEAIVRYSLPQNHVEMITRDFATEEEAVEHIHQEQQGALHYEFFEWVGHKRHIAATSTWYGDPLRKEALKRLSGMADDMFSWSLLQSCTEIIQAKRVLYEILPAPGNNSYNSTREKLISIIDFCEKAIEKLKLKKAG